MATPDFHGKVALVTGAGSGIGRASALAFGRAGAKVVVADIDDVAGQETVRLIRASNTDALFVKCDVAQSKDVAAMVARAVEMYGRLDFAHNNAGIEGEQNLTVDYSEAMFERVLGINLKGVFFCLKYEIAQMLKQGGGAIVNTASVAGLTGSRGVPAYVASKHGVIGLTKAVSLEYARENIRINAVCPGVIDTAMIDRFTGGNAEVKAEFAQSEPVGRLGRPEEVAEAVLWLCSDGASFVTGHAMAIDGGRAAER